MHITQVISLNAVHLKSLDKFIMAHLHHCSFMNRIIVLNLICSLPIHVENHSNWLSSYSLHCLGSMSCGVGITVESILDRLLPTVIYT